MKEFNKVVKDYEEERNVPTCHMCGGKNIVRHSICKTVYEYDYDENNNIDYRSERVDGSYSEDMDYCTDCSIYLNSSDEILKLGSSMIDLENGLSGVNNINELRKNIDKNLDNVHVIVDDPNIVVYGRIPNDGTRVFIKIVKYNNEFVIKFAESSQPITSMKFKEL